jgi:FAD/FMN-containing dehydrogenase/Fe-S oxidoreductase
MNPERATTAVHAPALTRSRLAARLRRVVKGQVRFDAFSRGRYATDASIYQVTPIGVVIPADEHDLQAVIDIASEMKVAMLPRGAGTSQCGQTVGEALIIDYSLLDRIVSVDPESALAEVQPGVVLDRLNERLKPHGLWFPVDVSTSAQATIGGMAGNNSSGSRSIVYGNMVHNVTGIDAIFADGSCEYFGAFGVDAARPLSRGRSAELVSRLFEIAARERDEIERIWPRVMRRVGGYNLDLFHPQSERPYTPDGSVNLAHLLVGSEGTLAHFRRLHLKLAPLPRSRVLGVVNFPDFRRAMSATPSIVALKPSAVELVDRTMIDLARAQPQFRAVIESVLTGSVPTEALLLVEFSGESQDALLRALGDLVELLKDLGLPGSVVELTEARPQQALWAVRKAGLNIMMSLRGDGKPVSFIEDCAVPLEHLAEYTERLSEVFLRHGTRGTWYAHASVGTLHVRPILDMRTDGAARMRAIAEEAAQLVRRFKGAFSGEHGDGLVRSEWVGWQYGPRLTRAFEDIKDLFDPAGLMNPGKIVRASRMDDRDLFRYRPDYRIQALSTALDWSAWDVQNDPLTETLSPPGSGGDPAGGWGKAVEMCNNNGHCRKTDPGLMCPSFRATRDERHLTRGRANALRLALSGQLGPDALVSESMYEAMSLCVGCKGCRAECPTGVDMSRMKIEFLHHWHARHGLKMKDRLIGALPHYAATAARLAPLLNGLAALPGSRWLGERLLGLSAERPLPRWSTQPFTRQAQAQARAPSPGAQGPSVLLFADTFSNYFEPGILGAARHVLEAAGRCVEIARPASDDPEPRRPLCCGRTWLAMGQVDRARAELRRTLKALDAPGLTTQTLVGVEPSCLLTFRDEALALGLGEAAEKLARRSLLFEEYVWNEHRAGRFDLPWVDQSGVTLHLHGHCHQKAFGLMPAVSGALAILPGARVHTIESGCCGMAGAFGYQARTHSVSKAIAGLDLVPALAVLPDRAPVVADGTSCRRQIADMTGRTALHVAQILDAARTQRIDTLDASVRSA